MAKKTGELTPLMKQFWDIKKFHADKILLFRMGDFFEMFYDDAVKAAPIIGIALTQRNKKSEDSAPMCGVPYHSIAGPINKLLKAGLKIAICDQIEDPKLAKGLVKRAVTRVLTPGMVFDSETLDQTKAHYICAVDLASISFIDTTTGECFFYNLTDIAEKIRLINILPVAEIVVDDVQAAWLVEHNISENYLVSEHKDGNFQNSQALLLDYVKKLSVSDLELILKPFEQRTLEKRLALSQTTLRHLEIFSNYKNQETGSLFKAIDRTKSSAGSRLLRQWLLFPLQDHKQINSRLDKISLFRDNMMELKKVREILSGMGDIERRIGKIAQPQCHGRDLLALAGSVKVGLGAIKWCEKFFKFDHADCLIQAGDLAEKIDQIIDPEAPLSVKQGHIIKKGFSNTLDELINLSTNAHSLVAELERSEKEKTGINSLKVRYNNVFGYYIEITNTHKDKAPAHYHRKQTLANAERFYTDELLELEKKVLSAQTKRFELEYEVYTELRTEILKSADTVLKLASICNEMDVVSSLAWLSLEESYCRPAFHSTETDKNLSIQDSRHAVVEQFVRGKFISNSISMDSQDCMLLTGPNMAGKSTLMRQVALTVILAQMGSYIPATAAKLPIYDAIFTRIGASDQLSEGLSTFMVEMSETAEMLKSATDKSLLILDEVGRGTATFDGLCLAQAILEYILDFKKAHVFFATHYHELTVLEKKFMQIKNKYMLVLTTASGQIEFLHILTDGAVGQSYGVKVAELAGLPKEIILRAADLLKQLEVSNPSVKQPDAKINQLSFFEAAPKFQPDPKQQKLIQELKTFSVLKTSPLEALNQIAKWQEKLN